LRFPAVVPVLQVALPQVPGFAVCNSRSLVVLKLLSQFLYASGVFFARQEFLLSERDWAFNGTPLKSSLE
jgi:hypothetical protein